MLNSLIANLSAASAPLPAPAFLFARGLGPSLSFDRTALAGNDPAAEQASMPIGLFELAGRDCGP